MSKLSNANDKDRTAITKSLLTSELDKAVENVLPDFQVNMTQDYFNVIEPKDQLAHLSALVTAELAGLDQNLVLTSIEGDCYTFINGRNYRGLLSELIKQLPSNKPLQSAKIFTSKDGKTIIDVFSFAEQPQFDTTLIDSRERLDQVIDSVIEYEPTTALEDLIELLHSCSEDYVMMTSDRRICRHFNMLQTLWGTDDVDVETLWHTENKHLDITIGFGNGDTRQVFERVSAYLGTHGFDIHRAHFETFNKGDEGRASLIGFLVSPVSQSLDLESSEWLAHLNNLKRLPMLSDEVIEFHITAPDWSLSQSELLHAFSSLIHQRLCKIDPYRYTLEAILEILSKHQRLSCTVFENLLDRFALKQSVNIEEAFKIADEGLLTLPETDAAVIRTLQLAASSILKTNLHHASRYALSFRIEPRFLQLADREELPYGVFFIHGKNFNGFHVRFRDISRGGMRIVLPRHLDDYYRELDRLYDENYGLALAQQLKNKDIPEGGSKGVLLVKPGNDYEQCGRAYADSLLDLITPETESLSRIDYLEREELLYLGPDENVSPKLIEWIIERATARNYPLAATFMSSKPAAGINHKVYGVTSEGVTVFLDAALRQNSINPQKDSFSVKITGGPDGDVAGNEILILNREYGENAKIVGIADGSGVAEDPAGLDHAELIRLVETNAPIIDFSPEKLSKKGSISTVSTDAGITARDTMHFRLKADAFIPAGGRPQTINIHNWQNFLHDAGQPSSKIIVEGANLFITAEARSKLSEAGVMIIKDSSANKCGVICSSLEIIAGMLINEVEFSDIKETYVEQTMNRLRELAAMEAKALFFAHEHNPQMSLPELSMEMSLQIIRIHDAISNADKEIFEASKENIHKLLLNHIPNALIAKTSEDVIDKIPPVYAKQIVASVLASQIVYQEGLGYCSHLEDADIASLALTYLQKTNEVEALLESIAASNVSDKERILNLLSSSGVNAAMKLNSKITS